MTQKLGPNDSAGGTAYRQISEAKNPYGLIPFTFAWFHMPVGSDFWCGSPGCLLRNVNDGLNFGLTEGFDCIRYNLRPVVLLKNVRSGFRPPLDGLQPAGATPLQWRWRSDFRGLQPVALLKTINLLYTRTFFRYRGRDIKRTKTNGRRWSSV